MLTGREKMADIEKVIKELNNLPTTVYHGFYQLRITHNLRDEVTKLLKEQPQIVRCKDCRFSHTVAHSDLLQCRNSERHKPEWFCADGEAKDDGNS